MWGSNKTVTAKKGTQGPVGLKKRGRKQTVQTYHYSEANLH